jgi:hypothetical protein
MAKLEKEDLSKDETRLKIHLDLVLVMRIQSQMIQFCWETSQII